MVLKADLFAMFLLTFGTIVLMIETNRQGLQKVGYLFLGLTAFLWTVVLYLYFGNH